MQDGKLPGALWDLGLYMVCMGNLKTFLILGCQKIMSTWEFLNLEKLTG